VAKGAVVGSGNVETDLMNKIMRISKSLKMAAMVGIDPRSDALGTRANIDEFTETTPLAIARAGRSGGGRGSPRSTRPNRR
jgi:acetaldehyde dehydrogenase (acetylating)